LAVYKDVSKSLPNIMTKMPRWNTPKNIVELLDDGDGYWEDERWSPILVTAQSGTVYEGREIPIAWQIEVDPTDDEFETAQSKLEELDLDLDGYGWVSSSARRSKRSILPWRRDYIWRNASRVLA